MHTAGKRLLLWGLIIGLLLAAPCACASPLGGTIRVIDETEESPEEETSVSVLSVKVDWDDMEISYKWDAEEGKWKAQSDSVSADLKVINLTEDRGVHVTMSLSEPPPEKIKSVSIGGGTTLGVSSEGTVTVECELEQWLDRDASFEPDTLSITISLEEISDPESGGSEP